MKKIIIILTTLLFLTACKNEPVVKDYVTLSGTITNALTKEIQIIDNRNQVIKTISLNDDNFFTDTLKVSKGVYSITDGTDYASLYLENGYDIAMTLDTKEFDETLTFTGNGSDGSNYLAKKMLMQEQTFNNLNDLYVLEEDVFLNSINEKKNEFIHLKDEYKNLDSTLVAMDNNDTEMLFKFIAGQYSKASKMAKLKGTPSPKFANYENYNGGTTSLDDLKGKFVYIDVWATWCGPCKVEIPYLKEVEKEFHDKNIAFVSISVDKLGAYEAWKKMIAEKEMGGIQLFAGTDSKFAEDYQIDGIPRFILIDDKGNIVNPDAPRPSNPKLKEVLDGLL
jgi:thiol-disulfide isomerase/thioredoxin